MAASDSKSEPYFQKEIQMMMFGLGDSQTPLPSTALIVESIVRQQLTLLLLKANEVAEMRESPHIELQDILFLMRKNKTKLRRLLYYLELKDSNMGISKMHDIDPAKSLLTKRQQLNRKEESLKFLALIGIDDVFEECSDDQVKVERMIRADQISQSLNEKSYQEFHKSRKNSFAATRLNQVKLLEMLKVTAKEAVNKLKKDIIDVLVYLAKETVAQLVDLALLVRQDAMAIPGDSLSRNINPLPTSSNDVFGYDQNQIPGPSAISPDEIREVMRRYWSTLLYPFSTLTVNTYNPIDDKLLFC